MAGMGVGLRKEGGGADTFTNFLKLTIFIILHKFVFKIV